MRASRWSCRALTTALVIAAAASGGCKSLNERYIALEVWKYERCFGHLPPGFTPPGAQPAAAMPARVCGQAQACQPMMESGCNDCAGGGGGIVAGGSMMGGGIVEGGAPMAAPTPAPGGVTAGKPVVISDELVVP